MRRVRGRGRWGLALMMASLLLWVPKVLPALDWTIQGESEARPHPGSSLTVYLMTVGQGDYVWEKFSHNAIWIQNEATGRGALFNWGIFDFGQVDFIPRLIRGTMLYRIAPFDPGEYLEENAATNRSVLIQELALTPEQKIDLLNFVEWNSQPENMYYRYDYYRDNCSTRVRDALDRVLGGRIREVAEADTTTHTYRWHTRRLLRGRPAEYAGIQIVLGAAADQPLTAWEEMFLPIRLMEGVREVEVPDGAGGLRPLVARERRLLETTRPPIPSAPPFALPWFLLAGMVWGGGIVVLSRRGGDLGLLGRMGLSALACGWALTAGLTGALLLGAWLFTDHMFWYRNLNLLQMNPLFLPLLVAFGLFLFRRPFPRWGRDMAAALGVIAGVGLLVGVLPGIGQANGEILALAVPMNLGFVLGAVQLFNRTENASGPPRADGEGGKD